MLRKMLDRMAPLFHKGGKLEKLYPLYEAQDTFLYSPAEVTEGSTHVRDALDTKRMMSMVIVALIPCILMALYNTGFQANKIIGQAYVQSGSTPVDLPGWRYAVMDFLGVNYTESGDFYRNVTGLHLGRVFQLMIHGALYFLPMYLVTMLAGGICEVIFSVVRKHEINEGFLVTGMLFPLTLPPDTPLWQVAIGIAFGVVLGKEVFGGTGKNFLNPALTARAFLYFSYATDMSGTKCWTTVDGFSGATILGAIKDSPPNSSISDVAAHLTGKANDVDIQGLGFNWWDAFFGNMHGSIGETSVFCCLLGAILLIATRIASWRIMAGCLLGMTVLSGIFCLAGIEQSSYGIEPWWHLVIGGFAFGVVFMATDPVSASLTQRGKWIYGFLIGFVTVVVRCMNMGFAEGVMLAILFGNCFAPVIDYFVVESNIKKRLARNVT